MIKTIIILPFLLFLLIGCGQDYNSSYNDAGQYSQIDGIDSSTPEGARLLAAYKVMQQKCFQCHQWSNYKTSAQWINTGRVTVGNLSGSSIYTRLKNNNGDMPPEPLAQLTADELKAVKVWIEGI
jgi:uncharacterized membrane protein